MRVNSSGNPDAVPAKAGSYKEIGSHFHGNPGFRVKHGMTAK